MNVTTGPGHYARKAGLTSEAGTYIEKFGKKAVLIGGNISRGKVEGELTRSLAERGLALEHSFWYGGESSKENIDRLCEDLSAISYDVLIAVGGGKAIDTVKAVAYRVNKPLVVIPTIAATCAATTSISILYTSDGEFLEISRESKAPELVLVDSSLILQAPARYLIAGIGDTLAKWFETKSSIKKAVPNVVNQTAIAIAGNIYKNLLANGIEAVTSNQAEKLSREFEDMIDAIILISGSVSGYGGDDCRTAAAHAIYSGLTIFPQVHGTYHGEIVAFGILAQLCMEDAEEEEVKSLIRFYQEIGLPYTLRQMGIEELSENQWKELGEVTVTIEDMANMPFDVSPDMVIRSVKLADKIGNAQKT